MVRGLFCIEYRTDLTKPELLTVNVTPFKVTLSSAPYNYRDRKEISPAGPPEMQMTCSLKLPNVNNTAIA